MADKSNFTADEWKKVLESPLLAGFAVSAGDPSGFIGTLQEGLASAKALAAAKANPRARLDDQGRRRRLADSGGPRRRP